MTTEKTIDTYLQVGQVLLIHVHPVRAQSLRLRSTVLGWHDSLRIILDRPCFSNNIDPIYEGCPCTVRFLSDGTACAFHSTFVNWLTLGDTRWCHLAWPKEFEAVSFRKHNRISFQTPCMVRFNGTVAEGTLRDISTGGCGLVTKTAVNTGTEIRLDFSLPSGILIHELRSVVRSFRIVQSEQVAGCEFVPGQAPLQNEIPLFINHLLEKKSGQEVRRNRVLVIDNDSVRSSELCGALTRQGGEAYAASTAIDGFARLRMLGPVAVAVSMELADFPGDEVVRLIRSSHAHLTLPIYLFGEQTADTQRRSELAGATAFFPESALATELADTLFAAVQGAAVHESVTELPKNNQANESGHEEIKGSPPQTADEHVGDFPG